VFRLLTRDELIALTEHKRRAGVIAWLKTRGWVYELGKSGWPKVSAAYAESRMGGIKSAPGSQDEPDWSAMRAA
jgi:hypothetical protein